MNANDINIGDIISVDHSLNDDERTIGTVLSKGIWKEDIFESVEIFCHKSNVPRFAGTIRRFSVAYIERHTKILSSQGDK